MGRPPDAARAAPQLPCRPAPRHTTTPGRKSRLAVREPSSLTYRYYGDTSRGNTGCYWMAKRAIDTNNDNWWQRYRACTETGE